MKKLAIGIAISLGTIGTIFFFYKLSKEVKKAHHIIQTFKSFEDSLVRYSKNSDNFIQEEYATKHDPKAILLRNNSLDIIQYIDSMKTEILKGASERNGFDTARKIRHERAILIKEKLMEYKKYIDTEFNSEKNINIDSIIFIEDRKEGNDIIKWETDFIENTPLAGVMAILTHLENQVHEVEKTILSKLE